MVFVDDAEHISTLEKALIEWFKADPRLFHARCMNQSGGKEMIDPHSRYFLYMCW